MGKLDGHRERFAANVRRENIEFPYSVSKTDATGVFVVVLNSNFSEKCASAAYTHAARSAPIEDGAQVTLLSHDPAEKSIIPRLRGIWRALVSAVGRVETQTEARRRSGANSPTDRSEEET